MPKFNVQGLAEVKQEQPLDNGRYQVECVQTGIVDREGGNQSLRLNFLVKAGPTQKDGSSPEDRRLSDFIPLTGYADMKDGGEFVMRKLKAACDSFGIDVDEDGFDYEQFVGARADVITRLRENPDGVLESQINRYLPSASA
jgi:hypothetical protein